MRSPPPPSAIGDHHRGFHWDGLRFGSPPSSRAQRLPESPELDVPGPVALAGPALLTGAAAHRHHHGPGRPPAALRGGDDEVRAEDGRQAGPAEDAAAARPPPGREAAHACARRAVLGAFGRGFLRRGQTTLLARLSSPMQLAACNERSSRTTEEASQVALAPNGRKLGILMARRVRK